MLLRSLLIGKPPSRTARSAHQPLQNNSTFNLSGLVSSSLTAASQVFSGALLSVYSDDGVISFSVSESESLTRARHLLVAQRGSGHEWDVAPVRLSGCIQLPDVRVADSDVTIKFTLPAQYPAVKAHLQLITNAPRKQLDQLSAGLEAFVAENTGSECLLLCISHMQTEICDRLSSGLLSASDTRVDARAASSLQSTGPCLLQRTIVWFHHIASPKKRRAMADWSAGLRVGGYSKVGYPGVLILEGEGAAVQQYVALLRSLRWKAMAVRGDQLEEFASGEAADAARVLPHRLVELSEGQLGDMGEACRAAGLESLFLLALKIDRAEPAQ